MAVKTKSQLKTDFSDNTVATGAKFTDLIDSLKAVQAAVSDPSASGTSVTFIATISQNENGEITATKKTVNFSGYQTTAGMSAYQTVDGMAGYQTLDLQQMGEITVSAGDTQTILHKMGHYPTVRLLNARNEEVDYREFTVTHTNNNSVDIKLSANLTDSYKYILD